MKLPVFEDPVSGDPSFSLTAAAVTLAFVLVRVAIGGTTLFGHQFDPIADGTITALLTPTLVAYVARQVTKSYQSVQEARIEANK